MFHPAENMNRTLDFSKKSVRDLIKHSFSYDERSLSDVVKKTLNDVYVPTSETLRAALRVSAC